jgi:hypothetical protein
MGSEGSWVRRDLEHCSNEDEGFGEKANELVDGLYRIEVQRHIQNKESRSFHKPISGHSFMYHTNQGPQSPTLSISSFLLVSIDIYIFLVIKKTKNS